MSDRAAERTSQNPQGPQDIQVQGELVNRVSWAPVRVLAIITGLFLIRGILVLAARYCLGLRRRARAVVEGQTVVLTVEWSILGRKIRETRTVAPISSVAAVRLENRQRYLYLLIGFGVFVVSTWFGIQWFAHGLRAGYPYLALVGGGVVAAGILLDLFLYFFIPEAKGPSRLLIAQGPWKARLAGVESDKARRFVEQVQARWQDRAGPG